MLRPLSPHGVKDMLADGRELAILDLREELIFSQGHLLFARSLPLSRLELKMARLVPRRTTRVVLCDDGDGLASRAADILPFRLRKPVRLERRRGGLGEGGVRAVLRRQRDEQGFRRI